MLRSIRTHGRVALRPLALGVLLASLSTSLGPHVVRADAEDAEPTLLVWAGDQAHQAPDFVAVVDFDPGSPHYGHVLRTVPLPSSFANGAVGNEPHHVGLSHDGRTLALGGLLRLVRGQHEVFFFDVTDPRHPTFLGADDPPDASITDEFAALSHGGFLVTFMGGPSGAHPGRVVEYDATLHRVQTWPTPSDDATYPFNPHGIARFCRKVRPLGQNPKIGYQKFNDLQTAKLSHKQLCDRTCSL